MAAESDGADDATDEAGSVVSRRAVLAGGVATLGGVAVGGHLVGVGDGASGGGPPSVGGDGGDGANGSGSGGGGDGGGSGTATTTPAPAVSFAFVVARIETCGRRCRDVTAKVTNTGTKPATGVTAVSRVLAGDRTVWEGTSDLGKVRPGQTKRRTKRVTIGLSDGVRIKNNGGYVTVRTTVSWDGGRRTFESREKVA